MFSRRIAQFSVLASGLFLLGACEEMEQAGQATTSAIKAAVEPGAPAGYWHGDNSSGSPKIVVHLSEQKAYFYKGKVLVGETTVSTGKPGFGTPPGHYHVVSKDRNHVSSEFGDYVDGDGTVVKSNIDIRKDHRPKGTHF